MLIPPRWGIAPARDVGIFEPIKAPYPDCPHDSDPDSYNPYAPDTVPYGLYDPDPIPYDPNPNPYGAYNPDPYSPYDPDPYGPYDPDP